jgi:hypothetical protein
MSDSTMCMTFKVYDTDLATKQFCAVKLVDDKVIDFSTAATALSIGVMKSKPKAIANVAAQVAMVGPCKAVYGDTVTVGQFLIPDSAGNLVPGALQTTATKVAVARALEGGVVGDIKEVFVMPGMFIQTA